MVEEFFKRYKHKIKKLEEILQIIKPYPRKKEKVIMCHGVFDVVHPGHVRHLAYAKSKAKFLIVSITADTYINKDKYRPHVPENIRALNLSAFEMVDFVIIDRNKTPLKNLKYLKPDFFAKGFEYNSSGLPQATIEETKVVNKYGGVMIFTPGDVVYSSSSFLDLSLPKLQIEKLLLLMDQHKINFDTLRQSIKKLSDIKIHVVGDTIIDSYTRTSLIGGQIKTPTLSVLYHNKEDHLGGAGVVAKHLRAAGSKVTFTTVLGEDSFKHFVIKNCAEDGIKLNAIIDKERPTTNKNAIIAGGYRLLKVDTLDNRAISESIIKNISEKIEKENSDSIIFSDFRHGIFNQVSIKQFSKILKKEVFKVADSQVASRWGNISDFKEFDLITPNEREVRFSLADQDSSIGTLSSKLKKETNFSNLILKLGQKGIFCVGKEEKNEYFSLDSFATKIVDAVGAGDALLAYSTLVFLKTRSLLLASIIGSMAAACECEIDGNVPIKTTDILLKIDDVEKISKYSLIS